MELNEIKNGLTPNSPTEVLLHKKYEGKDFYCLGILGGCENAPEIVIDLGKGQSKVVYATHWCKLPSS